MSGKNDRVFGFFRSFFIGLAVALLILLGVIGYRLYTSATREIEDSDLVYVDDTEGTEEETGSMADDALETEMTGTSTETSGEEADGTAAQSADGQDGDGTQESSDVEASAAAGSVTDADDTSGNADTDGSDADSSDSADETDANTAIEIDGEVVSLEETEAAEKSTGVYSTLNAACNFRSEAGYEDADGNDTTISTCAAGTVVEVLEEVGGWTKVKIDGVVGYVGAQFITSTDSDGD